MVCISSGIDKNDLTIGNVLNSITLDESSSKKLRTVVIKETYLEDDEQVSILYLLKFSSSRML